jgi:hypothetical protein
MSPSPSSKFIVLHSCSCKHQLQAMALLSALLVISLADSLALLTSHYIGGVSGDGGLYIWLTKVSLNSLSPTAWFDTPAFFPYGRSLAWSDNFILPAAFVQLLQALGLAHVSSYNAIFLASILLNGFLSFRLAHAISGNYWASLAVGAISLRFAPLWVQLGHPQLAFFFFVPLALHLALTFAATNRRSCALVAGLLVTCSFLTTVYYALFIVLLFASFFALLYLLRPRALPVRHLLEFIALSLLGFLPTVAFLWPYLEVRAVFGERGIYEAYAFAASGLSYLTASPNSLLYSFTSSFSHAEARLYAGLLVLLLVPVTLAHILAAKTFQKLTVAFALLLILTLVFSDRDVLKPWMADARAASSLANGIATVSCWALLLVFALLCRKLARAEQQLGFDILTNRSLQMLILGIALTFFAVSLGPLGNPERGQLALGPFRLLYETLPGFSALRAVSRSGLVAVWCILLTLPFFFNRLKIRGAVGYIVAFGLVFLVLLENWVVHTPFEPLPETPKIYQTLADQPAGAAIILPFAGELKDNGSPVSWREFARLNVLAMNWAAETGKTIVNGYSGQRSQIMRHFPRQMANFPDQRSLETLSLLAGLRYVVVHAELSLESIEQIVQRTENFPGLLQLIKQDGSHALFLFTPSSHRLEPETNVRTPADPRLTLQFEIMTPASGEKTTPLELRVRESDQLENEVVLAVDIPRDGENHLVNLPLPAPKQRSRPFRFYIEHNDPDDAVFMSGHWLTR